MKLYHILGRYYGTQNEAKAAAKEGGVKFEPEVDTVEVPTDKAGLIDYLNAILQANTPEDHYTTVVERQDPPIEDETAEGPQKLNLQYLQTFFDAAPLTLQAELAVRAIDRLAAAAPKTLAAPASPVDQLRGEVAGDDDLFR